MRILLNILYYPLILALLVLSVLHGKDAVLWLIGHLTVYKWFGVGMGACFALHILPFVNKNLKFFQTFSHELTHTIFSILFLRRIGSFQVSNGGGGEMTHTGGLFGDTVIALTPYCCPIFTFFFLFLRLLAKDATAFMWFDILVGYTLMFHITCFVSQTGNHQSDIYNIGYFKAYLFIVTFWIFNATIILMSIRMGIWKANLYLFPLFWKDLLFAWNWLSHWVTSIKR